jgi:hypothetical protein
MHQFNTCSSQRGQVESHLGLLSSIHQKHLDSLPYGTTGSRQIIRECTDWPNWARFSSIFQHQNIQGVDDILSTHQPTGLFCPERDSAGLWIISVPENEGCSIRIDLNYSCGTLSDLLATTLVNELGRMMQLLSQQIFDGSIPTLSATMPNPPLRLPPRISAEIAGIEPGSVSQAETSYKKSGIFNIEEIIEECWETAG